MFFGVRERTLHPAPIWVHIFILVRWRSKTAKNLYGDLWGTAHQRARSRGCRLVLVGSTRGLYGQGWVCGVRFSVWGESPTKIFARAPRALRARVFTYYMTICSVTIS